MSQLSQKLDREVSSKGERGYNGIMVVPSANSAK